MALRPEHIAGNLIDLIRICRLVEARGITCWIAPRDVPPGSRYGEEIVNAIVLVNDSFSTPITLDEETLLLTEDLFVSVASLSNQSSILSDEITLHRIIDKPDIAINDPSGIF